MFKYLEMNFKIKNEKKKKWIINGDHNNDMNDFLNFKKKFVVFFKFIHKNI
jgi:hypothetical protein